MDLEKRRDELLEARTNTFAQLHQIDGALAVLNEQINGSAETEGKDEVQIQEKGNTKDG